MALLPNDGSSAVVSDLHALHSTAQRLREVLESNRLIGTAVGILMTTRGLDRDAAFAHLSRTSQHQNRKLRLVAGDIVAATEARRSGGDRVEAV